jgi:leader peptidase (prepilin peptidase)/N-methyltransferase
MSLLLWFLGVFLAGLVVGSFLNFCATRVPYEKALLWPGPRCASCLQRIGLLDCVPLVTYALLLGRCRTCGSRIPWRYPVVELFTGLMFVALFAFVSGVVDVPLVGPRWRLPPNADTWHTLVVFVHLATLVCFLTIAALCDLADMEIPLSLTLTGTVVGLVFATLLPWPYPDAAANPQLRPPFHAVYPWPIWMPAELPAWLPEGSPQLGLATGLAGAAAGMVMLRGVRWLFGLGRGLEGMGVGDADLMMLAGAFIGWQAVILAFFISVLPGLIFALVSVIVRGEQALPFGPALAVGVLMTILAWPVLAEQFRLLFFEPFILGFVGGGGAIALLAMAFLLRLIRRAAPPPAQPPGANAPGPPAAGN